MVTKPTEMYKDVTEAKTSDPAMFVDRSPSARGRLSKVISKEPNDAFVVTVCSAVAAVIAAVVAAVVAAAIAAPDVAAVSSLSVIFSAVESIVRYFVPALGFVPAAVLYNAEPSWASATGRAATSVLLYHRSYVTRVPFKRTSRAVAQDLFLDKKAANA